MKLVILSVLSILLGLSASAAAAALSARQPVATLSSETSQSGSPSSRTSYAASEMAALGTESYSSRTRLKPNGEPDMTFGIGFWKSRALAPQSEMVGRLLPIWLGEPGEAKSVRVTRASQAGEILRMKLATDFTAMDYLYGQLLCAKLNIKNGADEGPIAEAVAGADAFLSRADASDWRTLSREDRQKVLNWTVTLTRFNEDEL